MSDLEQQRRVLKPDSGMLVAGGSGNEALQGAVREFASRPECVPIATTLEANANIGKRYFTYKSFWPRISPDLIAEGERLGIWRKNEHKDYWQYSHLTWKWVRTCIALDDERRRVEQERAKSSQGS